MKPVTQADIARAAGVTTATVSMALRNHAAIPEATRARIRAVADRLGYRPDPQLSKLMSYMRARRPSAAATPLALLTFHDESSPWRSASFLRRLHSGILRAAAALGYRVEEFWTRQPGMDAARLSGVLRTRGIEGAIAMPFGHAPRGRLETDISEISCIGIGHSVSEPDVHRVAPDQFRAAMLAFERLRALGYRRIGFALNAVADERTAHQFLAAYLYHLHVVPREQRLPLLVLRTMEPPRFFAWMRACRPDAVACNQINPLNWLTAAGVKLPDELGFAVLDRSPGITTASGVDQQMEEVGAAAVEQLVGLIRRGDRGAPEHPRTVLIEPRWVDGDTTRKIEGGAPSGSPRPRGVSAGGDGPRRSRRPASGSRRRGSA